MVSRTPKNRITTNRISRNQPKKKRSKFPFFLLLFLIGVIAYQNYNLSHASLDALKFDYANFNFFDVLDRYTNKNQGESDLIRAFENFSERLDANKNQEAHKRLLFDLQSIGSLKQNASLFKAYINKQKIPYDYRYFFKECLPRYLEEETYSSPLRDKNIIAFFPAHSDYQAKIIFNTEELPLYAFQNRLKKSDLRNRLIVTGTYTSPFNTPVGLTINQGKVLNPALQKWDGILVIDYNGKAHITDINHLMYNFTLFDIRNSYKDYLTFFQIAQVNKLTIIQSHLIISNGNILIDKQNLKREKFRRRVIFQTKDNALYVYDSFKQRLTFYKLAQILKNKYNAKIALNLDMGTYNYAVLYENNREKKNYSELGSRVILSNFLVIDYQ
jgi:hypothetical protein